jgi:hypothetical protein
MRQIFRSRRLETVEGVARLLADHGIETYISERRAYKGNRRGQFSFRDNEGPEPALWIVNGSDITRARELMAEAGLVDLQRSESVIAAQGHERANAVEKKRVATPTKVRIGLMLVVVVMAAVHLARVLMA